MTALLIAVVVCIASFIPAPDLDAPKVYYKACIYCKDCTPNKVTWTDSLGNVIRLWRPVLDKPGWDESYIPSCYRCQRTGKMMVFDSIGVVQWGKVLEISTHPKWGDAVMWDVIVTDTTVIADTSGIMRIQ